jgi:hypothetical protein
MAYRLVNYNTVEPYACWVALAVLVRATHFMLVDQPGFDQFILGFGGSDYCAGYVAFLKGKALNRTRRNTSDQE